MVLIEYNKYTLVVQGSTPSISAPFNMTFNNDSTITINHDLVNGDSLYVGFTGSNYTAAQLFIYSIPTINMGNTTWSLSSIPQVGTYKGFLRIYNSTSNMDYPVTLVTTSTIGVPELVKPEYYVVYDWYGREKYAGDSIPYDELHGFYVIYHQGKFKKVFIK